MPYAPQGVKGSDEDDDEDDLNNREDVLGQMEFTDVAKLLLNIRKKFSWTYVQTAGKKRWRN
jgi:hypothetical protein